MPKHTHWWKEAIVYELYVDKFAKDFKTLTTKLDYLVNLGINTLWILPYYPSPLTDSGYDITDFKSIRRNLGTLEDFRNFVTEAHKKNIKVIVDLVVNHTSSEHPWFKEARSSTDNRYRDYYIWSKTGSELAEASNPFDNIKNSNWIYNPVNSDYFFATFYPQQPDLNWDNPKVQEEFMSILDFWINLGVDGFRLDAILRIIKREGTNCINQPEVHAVIKKLREHVASTSTDIVLIAESDLHPEESMTYFGTGDECQMAFHFMLSLKIWLYLKTKVKAELVRAVASTADIPKNCSWISFLGNHDSFSLYLLTDQERQELGAWLDPEGKFSNKIGKNTAIRIGEIFNGDKQKIAEAFELLFSLPFVPCIYYGDEIGMRNQIIRPKPLDTRIFVRGVFDWNEAKSQTSDPNSILNNIKRLIKVRKEIQQH